MSNLISIPIPVYEMRGSGEKFLKISLDSLCAQTHNDFEVVISDHSEDSVILDLCSSYSGRLKIIYARNSVNRGSSSANLNNAIMQCSGSIIKPLMQDEYLYDPDALVKIESVFNENIDKYWLVTGCAFGGQPGVAEGKIRPYYSDDIILGKNTIGSPSVLSFRNENVQLFNEDLLWMMDCEYYKRLHLKHGEPLIIEDALVFICQHKDQVSSTMDESKKREEEEMLKNKYTV